MIACRWITNVPKSGRDRGRDPRDARDGHNGRDERGRDRRGRIFCHQKVPKQDWSTIINESQIAICLAFCLANNARCRSSTWMSWVLASRLRCLRCLANLLLSLYKCMMKSVILQTQTLVSQKRLCWFTREKNKFFLFFSVMFFLAQCFFFLESCFKI